MWAGALSTLLIGTDILRPDFAQSDTFAILSNKPLIDTLSQDPLAVPIRRIRSPTIAPPGGVTNVENAQLWFKPLANGDAAAILFNRNDVALSNWSFSFADVGFGASQKTTVVDLWTHTHNGTHVGSFTAAEVAPHGVAALRLKIGAGR